GESEVSTSEYILCYSISIYIAIFSSLYWYLFCFFFVFFFFFLMFRRPPRSTLFPTRRSSDLWLRRRARDGRSGAARGRGRRRRRSEEHTSELQSPYDLVCRLLLEKKNNHYFQTYCLG